MTYSPILNPHPVTDSPLATLAGAVTETAPASDTASSGLNGRLQRIAQRLSTMITNLGSSADGILTTGNAGSIASYLRTMMEQTLSTAPSSVKIDQTTDGTTNLVRAKPDTSAHALIPAPSTYRLLSAAATTNGANVKSSAGTVKGIQGFNNKASAVFLKLYNKATSPTVGTDTPVKTIYLPASAAFAFDFGTGIAFATGISIALTGAGADADTTALASGDIVALNVDYH
jgi:hypothetical protein